MRTRTCPGCALVLPRADGPAHPYFGASPECWALFGAYLVAGGGEAATDVYAVQHPGSAERRAVQSVGAHLMWLCLLLERGARAEAQPAARAGAQPAALRRILAARPGFVHLPPPEPNGGVTVADVLAGRRTSRAWALDVWEAWRPHHAQVRHWVDAVFG